MVKNVTEFSVPDVEIPNNGQIEQFEITEIATGELQEFVDPDIIKESWENADLTDLFINVTVVSKKFGKITDLIQIPTEINYRHKMAKIKKIYGPIAIGAKWNFIFDGKKWKIVLP